MTHSRKRFDTSQLTILCCLAIIILSVNSTKCPNTPQNKMVKGTLYQFSSELHPNIKAGVYCQREGGVLHAFASFIAGAHFSRHFECCKHHERLNTNFDLHLRVINAVVCINFNPNATKYNPCATKGGYAICRILPTTSTLSTTTTTTTTKTTTTATTPTTRTTVIAIITSNKTKKTATTTTTRNTATATAIINAATPKQHTTNITSGRYTTDAKTTHRNVTTSQDEDGIKVDDSCKYNSICFILIAISVSIVILCCGFFVCSVIFANVRDRQQIEKSVNGNDGSENQEETQPIVSDEENATKAEVRVNIPKTQVTKNLGLRSPHVAGRETASRRNDTPLSKFHQVISERESDNGRDTRSNSQSTLHTARQELRKQRTEARAKLKRGEITTGKTFTSNQAVHYTQGPNMLKYVLSTAKKSHIVRPPAMHTPLRNPENNQQVLHDEQDQGIHYKQGPNMLKYVMSSAKKDIITRPPAMKKHEESKLAMRSNNRLHNNQNQAMNYSQDPQMLTYLLNSPKRTNNKVRASPVNSMLNTEENHSAQSSAEAPTESALSKNDQSQATHHTQGPNRLTNLLGSGNRKQNKVRASPVNSTVNIFTIEFTGDARIPYTEENYSAQSSLEVPTETDVLASETSGGRE